MAMRSVAQLDSMDLPPQFSYPPYVPRKRISVQGTAKAVVTQSASPVIVHGDGILSWRVEGAFPNEFKDLYDKYNTATNVAYQFLGYWGEELQVYFNTMDHPRVRGRIYDMSGSFQVISVTTGYDDVDCFLATFPA